MHTREVTINGKPWTRFTATSIQLPYAETPQDAVILIAAFYFLLLWKETPTLRNLVPAALLTGFAIACTV